MQREQNKSETQLQSAGYVKKATNLTTPGQPTIYIRQTLPVPCYLHTDPATQDEAINQPPRPLRQFPGVGQNLQTPTTPRPRA
jgi:hypothetical protein